MPSVKTDDRFSRVIKFLIASREPRIARQLLRRGFSNADREEGWSLLDRAAGRSLEIAPAAGTPTEYKPIIEAIDVWENTWFDVAEAALTRQFPAVKEALFLNLSKRSDKGVVINVRTFVDRLAAFQSSGDPEAEKAVALLASRGLTQAVIDEIAAKLEILEHVDDEDAEEMTEDQEAAMIAAQTAAIDAMWAWYLDWSKTARTVVKNRNHRVLLGLSSYHKSDDDSSSDPPKDISDSDDAPVALQ